MSGKLLNWDTFYEFAYHPCDTPADGGEFIFNVFKTGTSAANVFCRHCACFAFNNITDKIYEHYRRGLQEMAQEISSSAKDRHIPLSARKVGALLDDLPREVWEAFARQTFDQKYQVAVDSSVNYAPGHLFCARCGADVAAHAINTKEKD